MTSAQTQTLIDKLDRAAESHWVAAPVVLLLKQSAVALREGLPRLMAEESRLVGAPPMPQRWMDLHNEQPPWARGE